MCIEKPQRCRKSQRRFQTPSFLGFLKPKNTKFQILGFLGFLFLKNINSFLNHILKVQKFEHNNLNHIKFNHTLMTLFPQSICV